MRWFIRYEELGDGQEPDHAGYREHLAVLTPSLSTALAELAQTSLHDGLIEKLTIDEKQRIVTLRLVIGDLQRGYRCARIRYHGAKLDVRGANLGWLVEYKRTELLDDELDRTATGFVHRMLFWPAGEIHISFDTATFKTRELPDRQRQQPRLRVKW